MSVWRMLSVVIPDSSIRDIPKVNAGQAQLDSLVNGAFLIAGAILVIFIIIGAIRYATSQGNQQAVQSAKEMIIYAFVGEIIVSLGFAIVQIVVLVVNG